MRRKNKDKKIKQLDIVFENCEVFTLTPDMIDLCSIDGIKNNIGINCFQYENGEVYDSVSCEELILIINEKGAQQTGSFDFPTSPSAILKDRLQYNDITHIDVIYEDKSNMYIMVPWKDKKDNEYYNVLQHNIFTTDYKDADVIAIIIDKENLTKAKISEKYGISY